MRSRSRTKGSDAPAEDGARRGLPPLYAPKLLEGAFSEVRIQHPAYEEKVNRPFGPPRPSGAAKTTTTSGGVDKNARLRMAYSWPGWTYSGRVGVLVGVARAGTSPGPLRCPGVSPANGLLLERRRRDSNPRYPVKRYNTLAGCRLQPLGHSSVSRGLYQKGALVLQPSFWISSRLSSSRISGFSFAGLASRISSPEISSFILTKVALSVAPKRTVREEM
jgi:hypothetical protein